MMRARLGLSAAQLANLVGASEQSVYNWETKNKAGKSKAAIIGMHSLGK